MSMHSAASPRSTVAVFVAASGVVALACTLLLRSAAAQEKLLIAHRGASAHAPENTQAAIDAALGLGADVIEIDVQFSRDLVPVVIHDGTLQRTTNVAAVFPTRSRVSPAGVREWRVRDFTVRDLRRLDAGFWFSPQFRGARILTLTEALRHIGGRAAVIVDIKTPRDLQFGRVTASHRLAAAIAAADRRNAADWVAVSSLDLRDLVPRQLDHLAKFRAVDLLADRPLTDRDLFPPGMCGVSASRRLLNADSDIVRRARERGRHVLAWGFDSESATVPPALWSELQRYVESVDVDGIMTNRLEEFRALHAGGPQRVSWSGCFAVQDSDAAEPLERALPPGATGEPTRRAAPRD
jgi:glycerophosphoryl diester phosphodiesterase